MATTWLPRLVITVVATAALLFGTLVSAPAPSSTSQASISTGYFHGKVDKLYPRGRFVTVASLKMPPRGWVSVGAQLPVRNVTGKRAPRWMHVRFVRMPAVDGTGDIKSAMRGRNWSFSHWHTIRGFRGRIEVRVKVEGKGTWTSPYRIMKTVPVS